MDTRTIGELVNMMESSSLAVMDIKDGAFKIRLERQGAVTAGTGFVNVEPMTTPVTMQVAQTTETAVAAAPVSTPPVAVANNAADVAGTEVKSPLVGTFHPLSSSSDAADVKVGDKVKKGQVICILEAMKLMNEIESDYDGEVVAVCANEGDLIEYDQVLFKIKED